MRVANAIYDFRLKYSTVEMEISSFLSRCDICVCLAINIMIRFVHMNIEMHYIRRMQVGRSVACWSCALTFAMAQQRKREKMKTHKNNYDDERAKNCNNAIIMIRFQNATVFFFSSASLEFHFEMKTFFM